MMKNIVDSIIKRSMKNPFWHLEGYMDRFWIVPPNKFLPFDARVHHIKRSDHDRALHDHPWWFISIILKGGYYEVLIDKDGDQYMKWWGPGSIRFRKATTLHRLIIPHGETCWSLFIMGRKTRTWGFLDPVYGWTPHDEYFERYGNNT